MVLAEVVMLEVKMLLKHKPVVISPNKLACLLELIRLLAFAMLA